MRDIFGQGNRHGFSLVKQTACCFASVEQGAVKIHFPHEADLPNKRLAVVRIVPT